MSSEVSENQGISRRDFLKLKTFMMVWFYFLQSFGINLFAEESLKKCDYSLLDKLLNLPFSEVVKKELELRVYLQKKYCYDANGNFHSLDRFLKEMINFIVSKKNFEDFKILSSIKDEQMNISYMFNATAKHNQVQSMKYLQNKLISQKDNKMLSEALVYAIRSQSLDTTIVLMKQKIKLDDELQCYLSSILEQEEYDIFCKKLNNKTPFLLSYQKQQKFNEIRKIDKKDVRSTLGSDVYYKYEEELYSVIYNATADMYMKYLIDDFSVEILKEKVYVKVWKDDSVYTINFLKEYEKLLRINGFDREITDHDSFVEIDEDDFKSWMFKQKDGGYRVLIDEEINNYTIDIYDLINIEIL